MRELGDTERDFLNTPSWSMAALRFRPANSTGEDIFATPTFYWSFLRILGLRVTKKSPIVPYIEG